LTTYTFNSGLQTIIALPLFPHTLQFTVTHALRFSVCTIRVLAITVSLSLQITHEVFFSQPNSFLAIILQLPIPKTQLTSIPLLPSSYPGKLTSRNSTNFSAENTASLLLGRHVYSSVACCLRICCRGTVFTELSPSNGRHSDFTIPASGRHITISF
jgi:hypothetical protein